MLGCRVRALHRKSTRTLLRRTRTPTYSWSINCVQLFLRVMFVYYHALHKGPVKCQIANQWCVYFFGFVFFYSFSVKILVWPRPDWPDHRRRPCLWNILWYILSNTPVRLHFPIVLLQILLLIQVDELNKFLFALKFIQLLHICDHCLYSRLFTKF
jgi:hypothetical protein